MDFMEKVLRYGFPTDIRFGLGARSELADFAAASHVGRPLLVTDRGLIETDAFRLVARQMEDVWQDCWVRFAEVRSNPADEDVERAFGAYGGGGCDGVVGLGGGSALDVAKAVRLRIAFPDLPLTDVPLGKLPAKLAPLAAIPTTAGTGSEVGRSSVITVASQGRKVVFGGPPLVADMAILDPQLTVCLPADLTAATGMDAMTHAVESFVCPMLHPMCDAIALEAIRMVCEYLPRAFADGGDLEARGMMQLAAAMGAVAFQKDLGVAHSLSHALSSEFGIQHGLANAIALPAAVRFNGKADSGRYARVCEAMGLVASDDPAGRVAVFLEQFNRSIGITKRLRDLGVPHERLGDLAEKAVADGCHLSNPRKCTRQDLLRLYEEIW